MRNSFVSAIALFSLIACFPLTGLSQNTTATMPPTEISADMGTCSALVNVTGADGKPISNAKISTRIRYGTFGVKKLDLETYTSVNGQAKIVKLPEVPKKPIYIYVSKDDKWANVEFQPDVRCKATFDVVLK